MDTNQAIRDFFGRNSGLSCGASYSCGCGFKVQHENARVARNDFLGHLELEHGPGSAAQFNEKR